MSGVVGEADGHAKLVCAGSTRGRGRPARQRQNSLRRQYRSRLGSLRLRYAGVWQIGRVRGPRAKVLGQGRAVGG